MSVRNHRDENGRLRSTFTCFFCGRVGKLRFVYVKKVKAVDGYPETPPRHLCECRRPCYARYLRALRT